MEQLNSLQLLYTTTFISQNYQKNSIIPGKARPLPRMLEAVGEIPVRGCTDLYFASGSQEALLCRGYKVTVSQLDLTSLTPLYIAGCGRLQLGVAHCATSVSVNYPLLQVYLIIDPTNNGSRFSSVGLLV